MLVVDDLLGWLVGRLADAGYERFKTRFWGTDQERALRPAVEAAVQKTADSVYRSPGERTEKFAKVINEIFREPMPDRLQAGQGTLLEALQAGIESRLTVLHDGGLTGGSRPSADVLGVPATTVAEKLTAHLVQEIIVRGSRGGPLTPLASQLNHDLTHLQEQRIEGMIALLADQVRAALAHPSSDAPGMPGRPLTEMTDPFALEVHRAIQPEDPQPGQPELPVYVPREHDVGLGRVVRAAAQGRSGIAVLVGGASTGKTRACWEALRLLRDRPEEWRLWHPIDPSRAEAALRELPAIRPRTVVWLNEAQLYLDGADGGPGERVAAGLRALLRDPDRAPVLVLTTLWPLFWGDLTARPVGSADPHAQARELLAGQDITVPDTFSTAQLQQLLETGDPRLAQAAARAQDKQVIQFLAGALELLARYRNAPPAAAALIDVAMDGRRLGMGIGLLQAFLEAAAPGYLTDAEWDALGEGWLEQALAYTAVDCKGVRGPLTRIRPRPARPRAGPGSQDGDERLADNPPGIPGMPLYRLADYLDQHSRQHRKSQFPPAGFWAAAAEHAFPADQAALGDAAHARGLYRDAAQLHKNAAARGNLRAGLYLASPPHYFRADVRPRRWAFAHIPVDDPYAVYRLLSSLLAAGAQEHITTLLHRDPAAHVSFDDPNGVTWLLDGLREAGAVEQLTALAERAAAHFPLNDPAYVATLLGRLREAGAEEQVTTLLHRDPAAHVSLDHAYGVRHNAPGVARLLRTLWEVGAAEQATALAERTAAYLPFNDPSTLVTLLDAMWEVGAAEQATALAERTAAHGPLDDPPYVAWLLRWLWQVGAAEQATALAGRAAAHVPLNFNHPSAVTKLLGGMREVGAAEQATALAERIAHASLDDPYAVTTLLDGLREAGAEEQATALAWRAAAHVPLDAPAVVARLLSSLLAAGAEEQITTLLHRDPAAHVSLDAPSAVAWLLNVLQAAGAGQQITALAERAAAHVSLDDPTAVAGLLNVLQAAGAGQQITALAERAAAHVSLDDPTAVAELLNVLQAAGAGQQITTLLHRDPAAHVSLDAPTAVARLLNVLQAAGAGQQITALAERAAAHVSLDDPSAVAGLLSRLRAAGAEQQATVLVSRLPAAGLFELFRQQDSYQDRFGFGREPDGIPAQPWGWENLD